MTDAHHTRSAGATLLLMVLASAVAGVLVAGMVLPVVGGVGLAAKSASNGFENLPSELQTPPLAQRSRILASDGSTLATVYLGEDRVVVPLSQVPEVMRRAIIAVEDSRFYEHNGIDTKGLLRAVVANRSSNGSVTDGQGASTLTQQYVKNVLLEQATTDAARKAATQQTVGRKLQEARYALALEKRLSKDEILERYLNIAYFGDGVYGVGTAATHYFGVPVSQLTVDQAALLAGLVKNPTAYDPVTNPKDGRSRRNVVLRRMLEVGYLDTAGYDAAVAAPVTLNVQKVGNGCAGTSAPFFCDFILQEAQDDPAFGATPDERRARIFQSGLTITTTLDPKVQQAAQSAVDQVVPGVTTVDPNRTQPAAAVVTVQPGTGKVLAIAQDRPYGQDTKAGQTTVNYSTGRGGSGFQAGSTFKVFTLLEALDTGLPLSYAIDSPNPLPVPDGCDGPDSGKGFSNADVSEAGQFDLVKATEDSINTYYIQLAKQLGPVNVARMAQRLGVTGIDQAITRGTISDRACAFTLGTFEVTPLEMASAYATIAGHGLRCRPTVITKVTTASGDPLTLPKPGCQQVLDPAVADTAASVLTNVITSGTATGAAIGRPAAGKTGTTQGFSAAWFDGFTPQLTTAVWVGDPRGGVKYPLIGVPGGTGSTRHVFGGGLPATIWQKTMTAALKGVPVEQFSGTDPQVANGLQVAIPDVSGLSVADATAALEKAGFTVQVRNGRIYDAGTRRGLVSRTSPRAGSQATPLSVVRLYLSNGMAPPAPQPVPVPAVSPPINYGPSPDPTVPATDPPSPDPTVPATDPPSPNPSGQPSAPPPPP